MKNSIFLLVFFGFLNVSFGQKVDLNVELDIRIFLNGKITLTDTGVTSRVFYKTLIPLPRFKPFLYWSRLKSKSTFIHMSEIDNKKIMNLVYFLELHNYLTHIPGVPYWDYYCGECPHIQINGQGHVASIAIYGGAYGDTPHSEYYMFLLSELLRLANDCIPEKKSEYRVPNNLEFDAAKALEQYRELVKLKTTN
jgi:hypothetical protein